MSLQGHEKAARILGRAMREEAMRETTHVSAVAILLGLGFAFERAAELMDEEIRAGCSGAKRTEGDAS